MPVKEAFLNGIGKKGRDISITSLNGSCCETKMGKNQAYKAMQRARLDFGSATPEEIEDDMVCNLSYYT
ncbi:hypothetical protein Pint_26218 [Pistacia integerrima]|uniref:Uncharacterized protein n=1 Tax=Pistacia integerrima TaxID=434235 RepID=A0ACC0YI75_9ROSI|nr:hypothetical protein Pint_26218 [Pistacia integerrima]